MHFDSLSSSAGAARGRGFPLSSLPRCRYYSSLRLPLMYSHPYSQITVETEFDNPIYETGVSPGLALAQLLRACFPWLEGRRGRPTACPK